MRDGIRAWDGGPDGALWSDTSFGEGIITGIKVLAILLNFGEYILMRRQFSIKHEQFLFLLRHRLHIDLFPLCGQHREDLKEWNDVDRALDALFAITGGRDRGRG